MSSISLIASISILVALMPMLGFPRSWESLALSVLGLLSAVLALTIRYRMIREQDSSPSASDAYVESRVADGQQSTSAS
jgi:hypothetical protein